jgi:hypothetical protein
MKKMIIILLLALFACEKDEVDTLSGSWDARIDITEFKMHLEQRGSKLTGDFTFQAGPVPIIEGRVFGDSVYIVNDFGEYETIVKAKYTENTMSGKIFIRSDESYRDFSRFYAIR